MHGPLGFIRIIAHGLWASGKMRNLLFSELINFMDKIILEKSGINIFCQEKYSETSENLGKIPRDTLEHDEPK